MKRICFIFLMLSILVNGISQPMKGLLDLRDIDFEKQTYDLNGEWEFYWNELIPPGGFPTTSEYSYFPALWNDLKRNDNEPSGYGYATYRVNVLLNPTGRNYMLHVEDMYSSFALYLNGVLIMTNGEVGKSKDNYEPKWKPDFVAIHSLKDTNEFVLQIANFDHHKGGATQPISIGEISVMKYKQNNILAYDLVLTGSLAMGGLFFLGLYFFGRHDRAILYFSIFSILYSYRIIGAGYYTLHHLVDLPWRFTIALEYLTLFLSTYFFGKFVQKLYPDEINPIFYNILFVVTLAMSAIVLLFPPNIFTQLVNPFFIVLGIYFVFAIIVYAKAYINKRIGSQYAFYSTIIVLNVFMYNILVHYSVLPLWGAVSFWGYILFFFSQSLILSYRFSFLLKTEKLKAELASQAKSDFLSTISHEIRTPLNAVVGISHLLLMENPRHDQNENLTSLKFSAEHLTSLINDILDYNKLEAGSVRFEEIEVNLHDLGRRIHHSYLPIALEKQLRLTYIFDERINSSLILDMTRMSQILNNLIDNGIKFTQEGEVKMTFELVSNSDNTQTICFKIADTGIGIAKDKRALIFERFTQASYSTTREFGGSGLGLSIVKKLLELQGVAIEVVGEEGKGTEFSFIQTFKLGNKEAKTIDTQKDYSEAKLIGVKVLLVEDNKMNVIVAVKFLNNWGIESEVAKNGLEAVAKVRANQYDLILMDLQMPELDGYEASRQIREFDKEIPIVALTASALIRVQESVLEAGMNDFVTKPFDPKELYRKILKYVKA